MVINFLSIADKDLTAVTAEVWLLACPDMRMLTRQHADRFPKGGIHQAGRMRHIPPPDEHVCERPTGDVWLRCFIK